MKRKNPTEQIIKSVVTEFKKKRESGTSLLDPNFKHQTDAILHPARRKAFFCTRRAAKSYTQGLALFQTAMNFPKSNGLYLGLTRMSAKGIIWKDVFQDINEKHRCGAQPNLTELTFTFPNGSIIHVNGIDADEREMDKLLGKKYKRVCLDEASLYSVDLRRFAYGIIGPALVDMEGDLILGGTSSDLVQGLFFDITNGLEPGWELFKWSAHDNPYIASKWQAELDEIRTIRPKFMETPLFRQWYLNEWVVDEDKLVYRFANGRNEFDVIPTQKFGNWTYVLGVDLGYDPDPSAFVVCAFHEHDPHLYILDEFEQTEMDITDVSNRIRWYQTQYEFSRIVIDGSNKQAVEEMRRRKDLPLTAADKTEKADFIQIMNAEFIQGTILLSPKCEKLKKQYGKLIWSMLGDKIKIPRKENPNCANHLPDAALYAWRFCYQFMAQPEKPLVDMKDKNQYLAHTQRLMEERLQQEIDEQEREEQERDIFATTGLEEREILSHYLNKRRR